MSRRSFLVRAAASGLLTELKRADGPPGREDSPGRPNFLVFITDQHNPRCFGYAGHPVLRTPNLDALTKRGTYFSRAYVSHPLCAPSRATLFTGLTTRGHRVRMNGISLDRNVPTITEALRQAGYSTHCVGKIHLRTSLTPNGVPLAEVDANDFIEARDLWISGRVKDLPSPYYGLESVDYANGHGPLTWGHYVHWIEREHPREARLFHEKTPLEPPGPAARQYNRECFKWALPQEVHPLTWVADRAIAYLDKAGRANREAASNPTPGAKPFFLWCSIQEPHDPFAPPAPWCYRYDPKDVPPALRQKDEFDRLPPHFRAQYETNLITSGSAGQAMNSTEPYRPECVAHYYGLIEMLDHHVGRILEALRRNKLEENTVVMFVSDHGEALGDHGMWGKGPYHYDGVIRISYTVTWPGHFPAGRTHAGVVSTVDFAPTILDLARVPIPQGPLPRVAEAPAMPAPWPGRSLVPILTGTDASTGVAALVEEDEDYLGFRMRTLVTDRYRLTAYSGKPYGELFDFHEDPHEYRNLWNDAGRRRLREELRLALLDKIMETECALPRQICRS